MRTFFLKLKSWQLFVLIVFFPMAITIIYDWCASMLSVSIADINPAWVFTIYLIDLLWIYSIANFLSERTGKTPKYLKVSFVASLLYISYYSFYVLGNDSFMLSWTSTLRLFILQLTFMIAFIYLVYQTAKALRTVELNRDVTFQDAFADLFCFLFFPIGLWFIQPRIRRMFAQNEHIQQSKQTTQP